MTTVETGRITTDIPARLDRLPWSAWHWRVVIALGVSWLLDGLEVTVVGSLGPALQRSDTLGLSASDIGWAASAYIGGAVLGALYFGRLADKLGRKRMFLVTLAVYLVGTVLTAFTWNIASFAACRALTGFGIGGEYAAINSAIDELIPARLRGRVDLAINGTFWIGAAMGAGLSILLLNPNYIGPEYGWRIAFGRPAIEGVAGRRRRVVRNGDLYEGPATESGQIDTGVGGDGRGCGGVAGHACIGGETTLVGDIERDVWGATSRSARNVQRCIRECRLCPPRRPTGDN